MGYSTTLYAVDLEALRSAAGSNDQGLIQRALAAGGSLETDPTQGPRVKVTRDSSIFLNGQLVTLDEFRAALRDPRWKDTNLYWYHERGHKQGIFQEAGSLARMLMSLEGSPIIGIVSCDSEEELISGWDDEEELSDDQAIADLVAGTFTRPECPYGYGLERLCQLFGTRLGVLEGKGRLKSLKINTLLTTAGAPVHLPPVDEFPYVGHLTALEVRQEVERLEAMDLSDPKNKAIEKDRRFFLQCLRSAADQGRAVVFFYY